MHLKCPVCHDLLLIGIVKVACGVKGLETINALSFVEPIELSGSIEAKTKWFY